MQTNVLSCVPEEIFIDHFLPFVPHRALIALKATCQYFNKLVWEYWIKYKTSYSIPYGIRSGKFEKIYKHFVSKLSNLTEITADKHFDDDGICQELDDFSLFNMLASLSGKLKKLDLLNYDSLCGNFIQDMCEKKIPALYSLEELSVRDVDFELTGLTMEAFENLKKLTFIGKDPADNIDLSNFKFPPFLETLVLDYEFSNELLEAIPIQCPNLRELHVKSVGHIAAMDLIESLPKLVNFHVILDVSCTVLDNPFFSVFKKKGLTLNLTSISIPYKFDEKPLINPFGIYAEKLTSLGLFCVEEGAENHDVLLNTIVCLKNLKNLKLMFDAMDRISLSANILSSLSNNSTLKQLESLTCTLCPGSASLIPIIVDSNIREIILKGEETEFVDFSFLMKCTKIETLNLDFESQNNNLLATLSTCRQRNIHFPNLKKVSGRLITTASVELLSNKQNIKSLEMVYDGSTNLTEFKSLKRLDLFMSRCFPKYIVLPLSLNNLIITSQAVDGTEAGFVNNILALKNLRSLQLKMEGLKNETVTTICLKNSPIEEMLINGSKYLTNAVTHHFTVMENLRNLMIIDCRDFKDCNEISLLEYDRNFHMFSSKIKERKFDFDRAYSTFSEEFRKNLKTMQSKHIDNLFKQLETNQFPKLVKERKLIELNFYCAQLVSVMKERTNFLSVDNTISLIHYLLLSMDYDFMPYSERDILHILFTQIFSDNRLKIEMLNQEMKDRLHRCTAKSIHYIVGGGDPFFERALVSILLDFDDLETISKISKIFWESTVANSAIIKMSIKFMEKCLDQKNRLLQLFNFSDLLLMLSVIVDSDQVRNNPLFASFCKTVMSIYRFNIDCPAIIDQYFRKFDAIEHSMNPFSNFSQQVEAEKQQLAKIDPLDESIPLRQKIAIAVDPAWADEDTYVDCLDVSLDSYVELFKRLKSKTFEAFGFKWYLSVQNGEYLEEVRTSLHLDSAHSNDPNEANMILDFLEVKILFMNFNFDPSSCFIKTHKFKFKNDCVSDNSYYNKDIFYKSEEEFKYRTIICFKLLKKQMKQVQELTTTIQNHPLNYLSSKHPWIARQIAKERPIIHETVTILTPTDILVDDCFSSNNIRAFGNDILFYIRPKSRKSGLFAVDLTDQLIPTSIYKLKYLFANESFDLDSIQIGKYSKLQEESEEEEENPYRDSEGDYNLLEPAFYQPTVVEREPGKLFNKYTLQLVMVLENTASGLDTGDPYDEMDEDDDWEDV